MTRVLGLHSASEITSVITRTLMVKVKLIGKAHELSKDIWRLSEKVLGGNWERPNGLCEFAEFLRESTHVSFMTCGVGARVNVVEHLLPFGK